ncbi:MAG: alpha/beta fold hydrolase [Candidatus Thorarchaeota archaeon]
MKNIIFIHGLESSGDGFKGRFFRTSLPGCLTPNFEEFSPKLSIRILLEKRMEQLTSILKEKDFWIIIGSSFGGLMATIFAFQNPKKVLKLILLAPFLSVLELDVKNYPPLEVPVIIFQGKNDAIVSLKQSKNLAERLFANLKYNVMDDDHSLKNTVKALDWKKVIQLDIVK